MRSSATALCLLAACLLDLAASRRPCKCPALKQEDWSYGRGRNGPRYWGERYPKCYGQSQSPIALKNSEAKNDGSLGQLNLENFDLPVTSATLVNNGHTAVVTPTDGVERKMEVEGKTYTLRQFHFHWGSTYNRGSEHTVDGKRYAMELHFVFMNENNEIAVVGVLFQEGEEESAALQPVVGKLSEVTYKDMQTSVDSDIDLNGLVPSNPLSSYFRYDGSLTTPGCDEGVTWSVVKQISSISEEQIDNFRKLYAVKEADAKGDCRLVNNYRPLQPLNDRQVLSSD